MIAIVTRTSNRPNYFNRCKKSISLDGYKHLRLKGHHIEHVGGGKKSW